MKKVIVLLTLIFFSIQLPGQVNKYGVPLIRNYNTQLTKGSEQSWCIAKDNFGNLYFGNQDRGVICYDGTRWTRIQIGNDPRIYSLSSDSRGIVYVGAAFEFGYLQPDETGKSEYISLASRVDSIPEIKVIFSILVHEDKAYFLSPSFVYVYDIVKDSLTKINLSDFNLIDGLRLIEINDRLILADNVRGLFELRDSNVLPLPGGDFFENKICTVLLPFDDSKILIGTYYNGLYLYDYTTGEVNTTFISRKINDKLKEVNVYAGAKVRSDLFAIGTTNEQGVLFFNKSGELVQQINTENSELRDNTILAMYCDFENNSELWISTQGVISKAYINIPLTEFSEKQGIELGINEISEFNGNLYLSSDAGVLKSNIDKNNFVRFEKVAGISTQVFPLERIKSSAGDILLAGSVYGIYQISKNDIIKQVERICANLPLKEIVNFNVRKILQSSIDPSNIYVGLETGGILILRYNGINWSYVNRIRNIIGYTSGILEKKEGGFWFMTDDPFSIHSVNIQGNDTTLIKYTEEDGIPAAGMNSMQYIGDELYFTSAIGIVRYDKSTDKFVTDNSKTGEYSKDKFTQIFFVDDDDDIWLSLVDNATHEMLFRNTDNVTSSYSGILRLLPNVPLMDFMDWDNKIYFLKSKTVYVVDKDKLVADSTIVNTKFVRIIAGSDSVIMDGTFYQNSDGARRIPVLNSTSTSVPEFGYDMNEISFEWTTPYFIEELLTEYSYKLEGFEEDWSEWEGISYGNTMEAQYSRKEYSNLPYGHYKFYVRTRTLTGLSGNELSFEFIILKPWYARIIAYIGFVLVAFVIIIVIIKAYTRKLKNENLRLEGIVAERTAVVVKQKDELEASIHYASRIQMALLPSQTILSENFKNYFILFKPRDIVSGDFYWMTKKEERLYIVVADCTGHGVPGAFMSLLGMSFLDEIIDKDIAPRADEILKELRLHVTESLKQVGGDDEAKDGMDIALLVIDISEQQVEFSGAYNPCFRVRQLTKDESDSYKGSSMELHDGSMTNGKYLLETIFASKMPIGISSRMDEEFDLYSWTLEKGISYYLFSDGYVDQFGGPKGRKFMKKNFKRLILEIQDYPMSRQKEILENKLVEWMGQSPQIDDILVMGIRTD